jgi:Ca-activated chloride channel homolog
MNSRTNKSLATFTLAVLVSACAEQTEQPTVERTASALPTELREESELVSNQATSQQAVTAKPKAGSDQRQHARRKMEYSTADMAIAAAPAGHIAYYPQPQIDRENYLHYQENGINRVIETPVSTFSIDVDTASYANVRRMLVQEGRMPPADAIRLEEMINYFGYSYPVPESTDQPFSVSTEMAPAPWSDGHHLLQVGLKGFEPALAERPSSNLVFLVDVSGSMRAPNKLGLLKKSLRLLVNKMDERDSIALVVYAGAAGTVLEATPGNQKAKIMNAINALEAGGSTHGSAGIEMAYALAAQNKVEGGINRVIIASDGDMNVGTVDIEALKDLVERKRETGVALTTLGFGSGNYNYALMEQLADVGNGNAAYIDSLKEAQKVLVNEMQSTLLTIASDVKIQVEFNPDVVSEYRLIGYENRLLNREDFTNDKVDAGDIGAGHTVTALYEIALKGSEAERVPALRYPGNKAAAALASGESSEEIAFVKLRYKQPGSTTSIEYSQAVQRDRVAESIVESSTDLRFAASVAGFGQLMKGGAYTASWGYPDALALAKNSRGQDPHGYRSEFIHLIELAQSLSSMP